MKKTKMNNFNFVHHSCSCRVVNLDQVEHFWASMYHHQIIFSFKDVGAPIIWDFPTEKEKITVFNALLKLTSQNLCTAGCPTDDPQQTCHSTLEQNSEKHQPHHETNPF